MSFGFSQIDPKLIDLRQPPGPDGHNGYTDAQKARDTIDVLKDRCGSASRDFPQHLWIEPKDWADKGRDNDKYHTWPVNYVDRFTNQNPTHECTCHSLRTNGEGCRNRQRGVIYPDGPKKDFRYPESGQVGSVWLSPLSIYSEANPAQWGGADCGQVLEIAIKRGFLPDKIQPHEYGFKHQLQGTTGEGNSNQSSGPWVRLSNFPAGWEETAKWFKPQEVIFTNDPEQVVCLVLHGYIVSVGRAGHAIPYAFWNDAQKTMGYVDSYNVIRYDSWGTVRGASGGAYTIASMTTPDDWSKPAGGQ